MERQQWSQRILTELRERVAGDAMPPLIRLNDIALPMLGNSNSRDGLEWLAAVTDLQRRGWITVDRAGYVVLTARGQSSMSPSALTR